MKSSSADQGNYNGTLGYQVHRARACPSRARGGDRSGLFGNEEYGGFRHVGRFESDQEEYSQVSG